MEKVYEEIKKIYLKYSNICNILLLGLCCWLFLFFNLGGYPLIDVDETRYVNMSRDMMQLNDYITPYLNFENFLEKPPLYFWFNVIAFKLLNSTDAFAGRFANALLGAFSVFFTYFFGAKVLKSKTYGLMSALVLLSSVWFLVLSHIAILDMGFMAFSMATIYSAVLTLYVQDKNKKWMWYLGYFFMALSVLMKGLIGIIVPCMVTFLTFLALKRAKEMFKPIYTIPGVIIFLLITAPWHIAVFNVHKMAWFNDYIVKHHFARFIDSSMGLGRKQPLLFYVPIVLAGIAPWTMSFFAQMFKGIKSAIKDFKTTKSYKVLFTCDSADKKLLLFAIIYALSTLVFFSVSSSKLPTYALTLFPAMALLVGYFWWGYVRFDKYAKECKIANILHTILMLIISICAIVITIAPPESIGFAGILCAWVALVPLAGLLFMIFKKKALLFASYVVFSLGIMTIGTFHILPFVTSFGQDELENFAKIVQNSSKKVELITFGFQRKYSLMNNYDKKINYIIQTDEAAIDEFKAISDKLSKDNEVYLIVKEETYNFFEPTKLFKGYKIKEKGEKYLLLVK